MPRIQDKMDLYYRKLELLEKWNELDEKSSKYPQYTDALNIRKKEIEVELLELNQKINETAMGGSIPAPRAKSIPPSKRNSVGCAGRRHKSTP